MSWSNEDVIRRYKAGKSYTKSGSGNLFCTGPALYSYGTHFPLAVRRLGAEGREWYLLNGDASSRSTNRHLSLTWRHFNTSPRISFSALRAAGLHFMDVELVDYCCDESLYLFPHDGEAFDKFNPPIGSTFGESKVVTTGIVSYKWWHRIGSVVLRDSGYDYLCSMDEGQYFISKLPVKVATVAEAFQCLKPLEVIAAEDRGYEIKRQGEWFFIPTIYKRGHFKVVTKSVPLPVTRVDSNPHRVTHVYASMIEPTDPFFLWLKDGDGILVSGGVRHQQHKYLTLDDGVIYSAHRNTELWSWTAAGKVD